MKRTIAISVSALALLAAAQADAADMSSAPSGGYKDDPAASPGWTGFYVGANAGYGWATRKSSLTPNDPIAYGGTCGGSFGGTCVGPASFGVDGALGGLQAGYNYQLTRTFLAGLEADFDWSNIRGSGASNFDFGGSPHPVPSNFQSSEDLNWFGTVRGRLGALVSNNVLVYGTGGFAYGDVHENMAVNSQPFANLYTTNGYGYQCTAGPKCFVGSSSKTAVGWAAGAGVEYSPWANISIKAEYLYVDLGSSDAVNTVAQAHPPQASLLSSFTGRSGTTDVAASWSALKEQSAAEERAEAEKIGIVAPG